MWVSWGVWVGIPHGNRRASATGNKKQRSSSAKDERC